MTNQEIREYLAENLDELKFSKTNGWYKETNDTNENSIKRLPVDLPDYIENWQQVVEKLLTNGDINCTQERFENEDGSVEWSAWISDATNQIIIEHIIGDTIGEAVCLAMVEYLKRNKKKVNEQRNIV